MKFDYRCPIDVYEYIIKELKKINSVNDIIISGANGDESLFGRLSQADQVKKKINVFKFNYGEIKLSNLLFLSINN